MTVASEGGPKLFCTTLWSLRPNAEKRSSHKEFKVQYPRVLKLPSDAGLLCIHARFQRTNK